MFRELFVVVALASACSAEKVATVTPEPKAVPESVNEVPLPKPVSVLQLSISSVYMVEDCRAKLDRMQKGKSKRAKGGSVSRCTQSTMQLSIKGKDGANIKIRAIQILSEDGANLGEIVAREPTIWADDQYRPWDEVLGNGQHRIAYKISVPNWSEVQEKIGGTTYGPMFFLEIKVESDGAAQTIRSPGFPRSRVEMMKT